MLKIQNPYKHFAVSILDKMLFVFFLGLRFFGKRYPLKKGMSDYRFKKILIIRLDHIGDVISTTPLFKAVKARFPDAKVSALIGSWSKDVLSNNPYVDEIIIYDAPWWCDIRPDSKGRFRFSFEKITIFFRILLKLRKDNFDLVIERRGDLRHILFFGYLTSAKYILSFDRSGGKYMLSEIEFFDEEANEADKNKLLLEALGIKDVSEEYELFPGPEDEDRVAGLLKESNAVNQRIVIMSVGSRVALKKWPAGNFIELACWLTDQYPDISVLLVGAKYDKDDIDAALKGAPGSRIVDLIGKTTITETYALLKIASLIITNDGPVMYMASGLGIATMVLFGPTSVNRFKPRVENIIAVNKKYDCSPCLMAKCKVNSSKMTAACMEGISVEDVKKNINNLLACYKER